MSLSVSRVAETLVQSEIRRMTRECNRVNGINLGQGLCDVPTPQVVRDAAIAAITDDKSTYALAEGVSELRKAIGEKLKRDNSLEVDIDTQIVVTSGTTGAFTSVLTALLNPGDGVLLFEPYYGYHLNTIKISGMKPQYCELSLPDFTLTAEALRAAITPETKAIVLCTPSNPSGKMFTAEEISLIGSVAEEYDLFLITDEIYEYFIYDGRTHVSPATLFPERTISMMGFSKTYSVTGWRVGYVVAPEYYARAIRDVNDVYYVCAPTPLQYGVAAGLADGTEYLQSIRTEYQKKRDMICSALSKGGYTPFVPQGAYYVLADFSSLGIETAEKLAIEVLERSGVAAIAGSAFYQSATGETLLRFCFGKEEDVLAEACRRLESL